MNATACPLPRARFKCFWRAAQRNWPYAGACVVLLAYVFLALTPFEWRPPRLIANGAVHDGKTVLFPAPGRVRLRGTRDWLAPASAHDRLLLHLDARPSLADQGGPARLFTISADQALRNLTIGQQGDSLVVRVRRPGSTHNGTPALVVPEAFAAGQASAIEVEIAGEAIEVRLDGQTRASERASGSILATWSPKLPAAIGDELTGGRPWLGAVESLWVETGGRRTDLLQPGRVEVPARYWSGYLFQSFAYVPLLGSFPGLARDTLLNLLCFVPVGLLLALPSSSTAWRAIAICAVASLLVELAQLGFDYRVTSPLDWIVNTTGGAVGAVAGRWLYRRGSHLPSGSRLYGRPRRAAARR